MKARCYELEIHENSKTLKIGLETDGIPLTEIENWKKKLGKRFNIKIEVQP